MAGRIFETEDLLHCTRSISWLLSEKFSYSLSVCLSLSLSLSYTHTHTHTHTITCTHIHTHTHTHTQIYIRTYTLFAFHIILILFGKVWIQLFSLQLTNLATNLGEGKMWPQTYETSFLTTTLPCYSVTTECFNLFIYLFIHSFNFLWAVLLRYMGTKSGKKTYVSS